MSTTASSTDSERLARIEASLLTFFKELEDGILRSDVPFGVGVAGAAAYAALLNVDDTDLTDESIEALKTGTPLLTNR